MKLLNYLVLLISFTSFAQGNVGFTVEEKENNLYLVKQIEQFVGRFQL